MMEEALKDREMRDVVTKKLQDYTKKNYPNASQNVQKNLMAQDMKVAEFNELRFMSRKKFMISMK